MKEPQNKKYVHLGVTIFLSLSAVILVYLEFSNM